MKSKLLDLGTITKGEIKNGELEYANLTKADHNVDLATNAADAYLIHQVTLATVKPDETGKFIFAVDTKNTKLYGPVEAYAYVVVDGKRDISETFKLTVKANIVEDFSAMTVEEKQQAPIIELAAEQNAGKIAAGLEIHRVYSSSKDIICKAPKAIKSGKKGVVAIDINAKDLQPGMYSREIQVISNDYQNSVKKIKINFVVE